ncbi:unnamed protein product, partial [Mesorhabditis spiculigera]
MAGSDASGARSDADGALPPRKRRHVERQDDEDFEDLDTTANVDDCRGQIPGQIISISMQNFMCHENLTVNFDVENANCFFVGGANGSGKSALLSALNIGLGGGARDNDRGSSVKDYIKEGTNTAKTQIIMTNIGSGNIPELGPKILFERTISRTGSSTLVVKSLEGQKMIEHTRKMKDIKKILERLGIQLDNPVFWMTQDRCRQFLNDIKPEKLFQIFFTGTQLEETEMRYAKIDATLEDVYADVNKTRGRLALAQGEKEEYQNALAKHEELQVKKEELEGLSWYLIWAPAKTAYDELKTAENLLRVSELELQEIGRNIIEAGERQNADVEDVATDDSVIEQLTKEVTTLSDQKNERLADMKKTQRSLAEITRKRKQIRDEIAVKDANIARANVNLRELQGGNLHKKLMARQNAIQRHTDDRDQAQAAIDESKEQVADIDKNYPKKKDEAKRANAELFEANAAYQNDQRKLNELKKNLDNFERAKNDEIQRFGADARAIVRLIASNRNRFQKMPIGPVGCHLKVVDDRWAYTIEQVVGKLMGTFVVDNQADSRVLKELLNNNRIAAPPITVTAFVARHHVKQVGADLLTVERMLEVDNDIAYNFVVDKARIESILLLETDDEARRLMDGNCPEGISRAQTISGAQAKGRSGNRGFYRFFPDLNDRKLVRFLKASTQQDVNAIREEIADLENKRASHQKKIADLSYQQKLAEKEVTELSHKRQTLLRAIQARQNDFDRADTELGRLESEPPVIDETASLKESLQENQEMKEGLEAQIEELDAAIESLEIEVEEMEGQLKDIDLRCEELKGRLEPHLEAQSKQEEKNQKYMNEIQRLEKNKEAVQKIIEEYERKRIDEARKHDKTVEEAMERTKDIPVPDGQSLPPVYSNLPSEGRVSKLYKKLKSEIDLEEASLPSVDDIVRKLDEKDTEVETINKEQNTLFIQCDKLKESLELRETYYPIKRHLITVNLRDKFRRYMLYRQMDADVRVDFEKGTIDLLVRPRGDNQRIKDPKSLSGGERSYLTAAFIMSLWRIVDSPFRCMDEFDVFMDSANRKLIMDLVILFATEECRHSQFILFTPQGITELKKNSRLKIITMPKLNSLQAKTADDDDADVSVVKDV